MTLINPKRPYFVRAMHEWLTDNDYTPYLLIDSTYQGVVAPLEYAQNGQLVLSISYAATKDLSIDNDAISFSARFNKVSQQLWIPFGAVIGIFAKEDQTQAMYFDASEYQNQPLADMSKDTTPKKGGLKILK